MARLQPLVRRILILVLIIYEFLYTIFSCSYVIYTVDTIDGQNCRSTGDGSTQTSEITTSEQDSQATSQHEEGVSISCKLVVSVDDLTP